MAGTTRVRVVITGVVQGVGFRYFAMRLARDYGITGWVRNRVDGAVEVEAEGSETTVRSFVEDLRVGPRGAHVSGVNMENLSPDEGYKDFTVRF